MPKITAKQDLKRLFAQHERKDAERFQEINSTINDIYDSLPIHIEKSVDRAVGIGIEKNVNGGIRKMQGQLDAQQQQLSTLITKIEPVLEAKDSLGIVGKAIIYTGGLAMAIVGIIQLSNYVHLW